MPYIDFVSGGDRVSLWYITNTPTSSVGSFDQAKPTIIMLHPMFLDSSWMHLQMGDARLGDNYNIIAFDRRCCGRSDCSPSPYHDCWVDAADLALAHLALQLPPAHIFAVSSLSVNAALRFAALFPELCKSLTLVNVPPPTELEWVVKTWEELVHLWCYAEDLDEFEHACLELSHFMLGKDFETELQDELIAYWATRSPPWRRTRLYETMHCTLNRTALSPEELAAITQPTLIIKAEKSDITPQRYAEELADKLANVHDGAAVHTVKGSPEYATVIPSCASIANRVFAKFLERQQHAASPVDASPSVPLRRRMQIALTKLAEFAGDPSIAARDPRSALSFSRVSEEVRLLQAESMRRHRQGEEIAFSPLGYDGRPVRRFSDRYNDHWFQAERDGSSSTASHCDKEQHLRALESRVLEPDGTHTSPDDDIPSPVQAKASASSEVALVRSGRGRRSTVPSARDFRIVSSGGTRRSTVLKQTIEKASGINDFSSLILANAMPVSRY